MASAQKTLTVSAVLTSVQIDPVARVLIVRGKLVSGSGEGARVIATYDQDVSDLMDTTDLAAATRLVNRAQAWIDSKLSEIP